MIKLRGFFLVILAFFGLNLAFGQNKDFWSQDKSRTVKVSGKTLPDNRVFNLKLNDLKDRLSGVKKKSADTFQRGMVLQFPDPEGGIKDYEVFETSVLSPGLANKFPEIRSYFARSIEDPAKTMVFSTDLMGFHGMIRTEGRSYYINPEKINSDTYYLASKEEFTATDFQCSFEDNKIASDLKGEIQNRTEIVNDGTLRTFRLALACTGEYAQFHINAAKVANGTDSEKKAAVLSAMNTTMTRVNGIFINDLSINMEIIDDNDKIIFLNSATDNLTNNDGDALIDEIQAVVDGAIGKSNYDIGHVFSTGGGGIAHLNSPCTANKARGVTGLSSPVGDPFAIDFVAHEMGHQYGATHTFNNSCDGNRSAATAVEPGSGSTIMSYAGICPPNIQNSSSDYFHAVSISQMWSNITLGASTCAAKTNTGNNAPTVSAGNDYTIPMGTPFVLEGSGTDPDGDQLTYNWEQTDAQVGAQPPQADATAGPVFRSYPPVESPKRYFPQTSTIFGNSTSNTWEVVPETSRILNFSFLVRDNNPAGGQTGQDAARITVAGEAGPFKVTSHQSAKTLVAGSVETISWDVANTNIAPVNAGFVDIFLVINKDLDNPIPLATNITNDGSTDVVIPGGLTSPDVRIMVKASDNIFFALNRASLGIQSSNFVLNFDALEYNICQPDNLVTDFTFNTFSGYSGNTTFTATNLPAGVNVSFSQSSANTDNTQITVTVSGTENLSTGVVQFNIVATGSGDTKVYPLTLHVFNASFQNLSLITPSAGQTEVLFEQEFSWSEDPMAQQYEIQISENSGFSNIIESNVVNGNSYVANSLQSLTQYFWRVRAINECGQGSFSAPQNFTTTELNCDSFSSSNAITIPASGEQTITSSLVIYDDGLINSVTVNTNITHSYIGDLTVDITSPSGTTVRLISEMCDSGKNMVVTFDDEGNELICGANPAISGSVKPLQPLSAFAGEHTAGTWTLTVIDSYNIDGGILNSFGLNICVSGSFDPDTDKDGVSDMNDLCPNTPAGTKVDVTGCPLFSLPPDNFALITLGESCRDKNDGAVIIEAHETLNYVAVLTGNSVNMSDNFNNLTEFNDLPAGNYTVCITVQGQPSYEQCYDVVIGEPESLKVDSRVNQLTRSITLNLSGGGTYNIELNGIITQSDESTMTLQLKDGINRLKVTTLQECQGVYEENILIGNSIMVYPNPFSNTTNVYLGIQNNRVNIKLYTVTGRLVHQSSTTPDSKGHLSLNLGHLPAGIYLINVEGEELNASRKIIKL